MQQVEGGAAGMCQRIDARGVYIDALGAWVAENYPLDLGASMHR